MMSGGNVQKVLLGREIESEPNLLITAYPVRGLDINSSYVIYDLLNEQKKKNVAVMYIGEDLDVLLELSDRIMVLCHGKITGILDARTATKEQIGMLMTGDTEDAVEETTKGGIFILCIGYNPFVIYGTIITGAFRSAMAVQATVKIMIPLLICSLGVTLAFKMRFWNIGAEGQLIFGATCASFFALYCSNWNHVVLLLVMAVAGIVGGGLWGLIPAFFKVKFNTNETLFTLMLNYIAMYFVSYLQDGPWRDPAANGFSKIQRFDANAALDKVAGIQCGWIVALILVVVVFVYLKFSKSGYEIGVVGVSQDTARYAGMNVKKIILKTMFLSGAICGLGGMIQASGSDVTLTMNVAGGVGFTAIIVAWLLQGIILFFILGCEFFVRYKFVGRSKGGDK